MRWDPTVDSKTFEITPYRGANFIKLPRSMKELSQTAALFINTLTYLECRVPPSCPPSP